MLIYLTWGEHKLIYFHRNYKKFVFNSFGEHDLSCKKGILANLIKITKIRWAFCGLFLIIQKYAKAENILWKKISYNQTLKWDCGEKLCASRTLIFTFDVSIKQFSWNIIIIRLPLKMRKVEMKRPKELNCQGLPKVPTH